MYFIKIKRIHILLTAGLISMISGRCFLHSDRNYLALPLYIVGCCIFIFGCSKYAQSKGYNKYLGLLGVFSCLGLFILYQLPDKSDETTLFEPKRNNTHPLQKGVWPPAPNENASKVRHSREK
jgi:hypothetical protein